MRPLTEDQLSMLLSDAEVPSGMTCADLDLTYEQADLLGGKHLIGVGMDATDAVLDFAHKNGLVPCGYCFGTGETRGVYWCDGPQVYSFDQAGYRRYICNYCEGTGVAR